MPTLGQSNASIYGDIQLPKLLSITGPQSLGRASAGPNAAMTKLAIDQQKDQQVQQLAQQYLSDPDNKDYDGFVGALTAIDPERGIKAQQAVADARQAEAKNRLAQTESSLKDMTWVEDGVKLAIRDPSQYPKLLGDLAKAPGGQRFLQYAPDPNDPDLQQKLENILPVFVDTKDFQKVSQQSYRDYLNGDLELSAVRKLASADTPQKRQIVENELKGAGLKDYIQQYPDAASAAQARDTLIAQQPQKAGTEKGGQAKEGMYKGKRTFGVFDPNTNTFNVDGQQVSASEFRPIAPQSAGGGGGGAVAPSAGDLTPEGIDYAATIYRLTNKMPPLGMGKTPARGQIINKAAEQTRLLGQTPVAAIQRQAMFSADNKSLGKIQTMSDAASAYEQKALSQLDIVDNLSDKVSRSSIPLLNRALLAGKTEIQGDPNATLLLNAIQTATAEYSKIMAGGTGSAQASSDSAMREAQKLLSASFSAPTLRKATGLMRQEMGLTMQGYDAAIKHIQDRIGGSPQQGAPDTAAPAGLTQKIGRFTVTVK